MPQPQTRRSATRIGVTWSKLQAMRAAKSLFISTLFSPFSTCATVFGLRQITLTLSYNTVIFAPVALTIQELAEAVRDALADAEEPKNGQVRPIPDARSIRYYTTLGLLDRPAAMEGRTALYDERHVRQLVAIKRLQAEGLSLAEIQQKLRGAPPEPKPRTKPRGTAFWKEQPAAPVPPQPRTQRASTLI